MASSFRFPRAFINHTKGCGTPRRLARRVPARIWWGYRALVFAQFFSRLCKMGRRGASAHRPAAETRAARHPPLEWNLSGFVQPVMSEHGSNARSPAAGSRARVDAMASHSSTRRREFRVGSSLTGVSPSSGVACSGLLRAPFHINQAPPYPCWEHLSWHSKAPSDGSSHLFVAAQTPRA